MSRNNSSGQVFNYNALQYNDVTADTLLIAAHQEWCNSDHQADFKGGLTVIKFLSSCWIFGH